MMNTNATQRRISNRNTIDHQVIDIEANTPVFPFSHNASILFCDLVDSTRISVSLSPRRLRSFLLDYYRVGNESISRYEGVIIRYVGDGIMAVFCHGPSPESDARNAVEAAIELNREIGRRCRSGSTIRRGSVSSRVSISTGNVLLGGLIGEGPAQQESVFGATPFLAAKLKEHTLPGGISISESTFQLVDRNFVTRSLGKRDINGFDDPISLWEVIGVSS